MKKLLLLVFSIFFITNSILAQFKVEIILFSSKIDSNETIFISGNSAELGNWDPGKVQMTKVNDTTFTKTLYFHYNEVVEFKFTLGNWNREALNNDSISPGNFLLNVKNDTLLTFHFKTWGENKPKPRGQVTGKVIHYKEFKSSFVIPRDLIVWLPPSYDSLTQKRYPVLYMQDGQNIIDPLTAMKGIDWQVDETADSLIKNSKIKEIIIVGIYNTHLRSSEYGHNTEGYNYLKFITTELKPFIDSSYRTLPQRENTAIAGSSSGGLISFMLVWEYPDIFSKAACLSPAFKIGNIDYVTNVNSSSGEKRNLQFYIYNGGISLEEKLQPGIDEMLRALNNKGYLEGREIYWVKDENAQHDESAWATEVGQFLDFFFGVK